MSERFTDLKKIPREPAARLLAQGNARLKTKVAAPANAPVETVLNELDAAGAWLDILRLFSAALPPREATWWACLAARDVVTEDAKPPATLVAAEAWVFKPTDENREAAHRALTVADNEETDLCAMAAVYSKGSLGPGELDKMEAPPGGAQVAVLGMNLRALKAKSDTDIRHADILIARAIDIARGGNGKLAPKEEA